VLFHIATQDLTVATLQLHSATPQRGLQRFHFNAHSILAGKSTAPKTVLPSMSLPPAPVPTSENTKQHIKIIN
jgi:hypothetical protein